MDTRNPKAKSTKEELPLPHKHFPVTIQPPTSLTPTSESSIQASGRRQKHHQIVQYITKGDGNVIYVTGDTHGGIDINKLSTKAFKDQKYMTKNDYLIVCGDFGFVWDGSNREKWYEKWFANKNFTTLWVDGNHENYDMLSTIPTKEMFGGIVQETSKDVFHLMRGQIYTIDGVRLFTMGGASSTDKVLRKEHTSWWKEELPSDDEMNTAICNLDDAGWNVDYVLTHCAPRSIQNSMFSYGVNDTITAFFDHIKDRLSFKRWFFGHYHTDADIGEFRSIYNDIEQIQK